ncbi:outer membrane protein assembly factor BamB family protein [Streptomyces sp. NBC_01803]|uniref:outer membrane protein assembly factor BamB family protein n=1 Tax=Streptomyces sp. NBC_01803 TaxID=2975946 RepID=UPI002DDBF771|nr:PQQ-binding-like beta-propeller repeat protein [Streptomyces sp. NBC_01803]WSA44605.1 PQQ-binding-like beta-propeller repeat protein [Streptomyces sp. NBC_01803]
MPGQPGYGYPQPYRSPTIGGPPAVGGGFGAPTAPGPYGPPTGGWAAPPAPPAPRPPASRPRGPLIVIAVSAVLALLLAGGGAVWLLTGDDDQETAADQPSGPEGGEGGEGDGGGDGGLPAEPIQATLAWDLPSPRVTAEQILIDAKGAWFVDDAFVRVMPDALVSYDLATGEENWSLPFESSEGNCLTSPNVSENRVALLQGRDCEVLTVVDIATGQEVMSMPLDSEWPTSSTSYPAILGDVVAVGTGVGGMGYSVSGEEKLWESRANDRCREGEYMVVDDMFISKLTCGSLGDEGGSVRATDEAGTELWEWEYEGTYENEALSVDSVVSVDPLVVTATVGDDISAPGGSRVFVVDERHREVAHDLDYDIDRYLNPCEVSTLHNCWPGVVHDGFLYLPTNVPYGDNAVAAFDLTTGQALYEVEAINGGQIWPFGTQDGKILAYQPASDTLEGMVVAIDPETEGVSPVMALDRAARAQEFALMSGYMVHNQQPMWHDNTLVLVNRAFYDGDDARRPALLVYR